MHSLIHSHAIEESRMHEYETHMVCGKNGFDPETIATLNCETIALIVHQCVLDTIYYDYHTYVHIVTYIADTIIQSITQENRSDYVACLARMYHIMRDIPTIFEFDALLHCIVNIWYNHDKNDYVTIVPIIAFVVTHEGEQDLACYGEICERLASLGLKVNANVEAIISDIVQNREMYKAKCRRGEIEFVYFQI